MNFHLKVVIGVEFIALESEMMPEGALTLFTYLCDAYRMQRCASSTIIDVTN